MVGNQFAICSGHGALFNDTVVVQSGLAIDASWSETCVAVSLKNPSRLRQVDWANHVVIAPFTDHHMVEDAMSEMGPSREIALKVPHFTSLFSSIATTDPVLTLPTRIAKSFASEGRMRVLPLPFQVPPFEVNMNWHSQAEASAAQQRFCDTIKRTLSNV